MSRLRSWFSKVTLGYPGHSVKLCLWMILDNYLATVPYAVMVVALFLLFSPLVNPGAPIPSTGLVVLCGVLAIQSVVYCLVARKAI